MCHPATYLNKVVLGSRQGRLQLWNVRSRALVYEFAGWGSGVTCIEQSTAVDVVAVGAPVLLILYQERQWIFFNLE